MSLALQPQLFSGDKMSRSDLLARWEQMPDLKCAELIDGVVHIPPPADIDHGSTTSRIIWWLTQYEYRHPGCEAASNVTWLMLESSPQPDAVLRLQTGQSTETGDYFSGAPELAVDVCVTNTEIEFGPKLRLYQRAGVQEYITIETLHKRVTWRKLVSGAYQAISVGSDGVFRSAFFPGLWLNAAAFWEDNGHEMDATLLTATTP